MENIVGAEAATGPMKSIDEPLPVDARYCFECNGIN